MVLKTAHDGNLTDNARLHSGIDGFVLVNDFNGDDGVIGKRTGLVHLGKASTTEETSQLVLAEEYSAGRQRRERRRRGRTTGLHKIGKGSRRLQCTAFNLGNRLLYSLHSRDHREVLLLRRFQGFRSFFLYYLKYPPSYYNY